MNEHKGGLDPKIKYTVTSFKNSSFLFPGEIDFEGIKFLEIGAGQSDIVAQLRLRGAEAYALDPGYDKPDVLNKFVDKYLREEVLPDDQAWFNDLQIAREIFRRDFANFRKFYKAGFSIELPFPKNMFDLVVSSFCICPVVSPNRANLHQSAKEIVRVLKPEKMAVIYPFDNYEDLYEGKLKKAGEHEGNLQSVKEYLVSNQHSCFEFIVPWPSAPEPLNTRKLLVIQKAE